MKNNFPLRRGEYWPGVGKSHFHQQLGLACNLMYEDRSYTRYPLLAVKIWIEPALRHRQIGFFFDEFNNPVGYVTWAFLTSSVSDRWTAESEPVLHESEWNEGDELWFLDFVARPGWTMHIVKRMRRELFLDYQIAKYVRRDNRGKVIKVSTQAR